MADYIKTEDGFLVDPETGEIVGNVEVKSAFMVDSQESLDWVMKKRLELITAKEARKSFYATVASQGEKEIKAIDSKLKWWNMRFAEEVKNYVIEDTADKKVKYIRTPYGDVKLQHQQLNVIYKENETTKKYIKDHFPEIISIENKKIESIDKDLLKEKVKNGTVKLPSDLFTVRAAGDQLILPGEKE